MTTSNLMYLYKIFHTFNVSCVGYKGIVISWPLVGVFRCCIKWQYIQQVLKSCYNTSIHG